MIIIIIKFFQEIFIFGLFLVEWLSFFDFLKFYHKFVCNIIVISSRDNFL